MPAKKNAFDLASLDTVAACNKPFELQIKNVHGNPTPFFISVLGKDSDVYRGIVDGIGDSQLASKALGKDDEPQTMASVRATNIDALVAVTVSWRVADSKTVPLDGEELECTPENVRKVYSRLIPVREQVGEAVNKVQVFMRAS